MGVALQGKKQQPLQRRGHFYITNAKESWINTPTDGFKFIANDGSIFEELHLTFEPKTDITLSWRKVPVHGSGGEARTESFLSLAFAMRRMANIMEGKVTFEEFATQPSQKPVVVKR